jgi:hypothetical protein
MLSDLMELVVNTSSECKFVRNDRTGGLYKRLRRYAPALVAKNKSLRQRAAPRPVAAAARADAIERFAQSL